MSPAGFKRSRALWDDARRPHPTRTETIQAYLAAIAYELQPVRLSESSKQQALQGLKNFLQSLVQAVKSLPVVALAVFSFLSTRSLRQWMIAGGVVAYYFFLRWVHEVLDAGPIVVIATLLALIFTIGLSDEKREGLSAYSIFNRGFERLMGSVDADSLLAQHVGGGLGGGMMNQNDDQDDNIANANRRHPEVRPQRRDNQDDRHNDNRHDDDEDNDQDRENQERNNADNRARKSGKKARRRDPQQRRDLRQQREVALQMGLDGTEGPEEMMAMQRFIEEQIAAEHNHG